MMIHESRHKATDSRRRVLAPSLVARKSSGPEYSGTNTLRQRLGNQGIQRLMGEIVSHSKSGAQTRSPAIQAKLAITQPGDAHEQEADRVANAVMRMPESSVQEIPLALPVAPSAAANIQSLRGGGSPLPESTRAFFEPRFEADFSQVRLHTDALAADTATSINAKAFTVGRDIAFGAGQYAPESGEGQRLLAHELTHVVQQSGGSRRIDHTAAHTEGYDVSRSTLSISRSPVDEEKKKAAALAVELQKLIDGAVWKEIRKRVYPKESAAGIKRAKERQTGKRPDLTGLGKLTTLNRFATAIKSLQGKWGPISPDDRVNAIGAAANAELVAAGVPAFRAVAKVKTEWKGFFQAGQWKFSISEDLVNGAALSNADAAELSNTALHEARHAEQNFLSARYSAGPPDNKSAADIAAEQGIPGAIAAAAVAAKFDAATDPKVVALGKEMYKANVTEGAANQKISDDDYTREMKTARDDAVTSLAALKAAATAATIADATAKRDALKAAIAEVEKRYTLYRNIPYEADAHEVGDAVEQAFKRWP